MPLRKTLKHSLCLTKEVRESFNTYLLGSIDFGVLQIFSHSEHLALQRCHGLHNLCFNFMVTTSSQHHFLTLLNSNTLAKL